MTDDPLTRELKQFLLNVTHNTALVGIASIDRFEGAPAGHRPQDFIALARSVVVIALPIVSGLAHWDQYMEDSSIVKDVDVYTDENGREKKWSPRTSIRKHIERRCCYEVINDELQAISMYGAIYLEQAGYDSAYLPTTYGQTLSWPGNYIWNYPKPPGGMAPFSHRHAAVAAGLGEFGLNNLLLTPQFGPRQRLVSIITEAPLQADPMIKEPICLGVPCSLCIKHCPAQAFSGDYDLEIGKQYNRLAKMNIEACRNFYKDSFSGTQCARECLNLCPIGKRRPARQPNLSDQADYT